MKKPQRPALRGVVLFANGRMVNGPEFFGVAESSHAFSYLAGWLDVDFIDDMEEDVISTNRQSLSWELPETSDLRKLLAQCLRSIEADWRTKRKEETKKENKGTNSDRRREVVRNLAEGDIVRYETVS